jgi:hypothetical protein
MESASLTNLNSALQTTRKFTAIWQSEPNGRDWPLYNWLTQLFAPYISESIFDGKHQVVKDNVILFDAWVYARDPAYYAKFHGKNAFLVHPFDEFFDLGVDRYVHFRGVFRQYWSSVFNPKHVMVFPLGSYIEQIPTTVVRASDRRYAWSFIGEGGKSSRPDMVRAMSSIEPHICFSTSPIHGIAFFDRNPAGKKKIPLQDTFEILGQSVFAPAPMGNANVECDRFYAALEVGAIPIVERRLTLDYYRRLLGDHPVPTVTSWSQARELVIQLLKDPERLDELQQTCMQWWKGYKSELIERIGVFLDERSLAEDDLVPLQSRLPQLPFWQYAELLRHLNIPALSRRVVRQAMRVVHEKRWRVAITKQGDV